MSFKPPLSFDELKAIQDLHPDDPDVKALLCEIKQLHAVVLHAHQVARTIAPNPNGTAMSVISWALWNDIEDDMAINSAPAMTTRISPNNAKPPS